MARPKISVIIPSIDGQRGGNVEALKRDLRAQTWAPDELIVVVGVKPNGRARNVGFTRAHGDFLVFIDDDVRLGHKKVLENLVLPFLEHPEIGLTGPSQRVPRKSSLFQQWVAFQIPRWQSPFVNRLTDSDMVTHMCLALPRKLYGEIGGEDPDLIRGTDPDLRFRLKKMGKRIVLVPHTWAYHPVPSSFSKLLKLGWKNGLGAAQVFRTSPDKVYETPDFAGEVAPKPFYWRWIRRVLSVFLSAIQGKWLRSLYELAYIGGYFFGFFMPAKLFQDRTF